MRTHVLCWTGALALTLCGQVAMAQTPSPAPAPAAHDDKPSIKVGATLFPLFTLQSDPKVTDVNGDAVSKNLFDVGRAYINVTGNLSHIVSFRITPDITRESALITLGPGNAILNDSLVFRIKYAYGQFGLDDWMAKGTWVRLGIQQTPWVDFDEGIYRYRFQGTVFAERVPLPTPMASSDAGVSFHYNLPSSYGEIHTGIYNGENYGRAETNNQKAVEFRGSLRPFATQAEALRGLRAHLIYYNDHYAGGAPRRRFMANATYEHKFLNAEVDYLKATDQAAVAATAVESNGWAFWATPRKPLAHGASFEALVRHDHWTPNTSGGLAPASTTSQPGVTHLAEQHQDRTILGGAYWFPHEGTVSTALMVDWDALHMDHLTTTPTRVLSVHGLINF